jgi:hypothetical protein
VDRLVRTRNSVLKVMSVLRAGEERRSRKRGRRRVRSSCSQVAARRTRFRSRRRETVVDTLAVLRACTTEKVLDFAVTFGQNFFKAIAVRRSTITRYLIKLLLQALPKSVGAD